MICRLCLNEALNYWCVFADDGEVLQSETIKIVAKYFQIELQKDDIVSNKLCADCWNQIYEFHKFCQQISEKQETLKQQWECPQIKPDIDALEEAEMITVEPLSLFQIDNKDVTLCEPEIDLYTGVDILVDGAQFDDDVDDEFNGKEALLIDPVEEQHDEKPKVSRRGRPRGKYKKKTLSNTTAKKGSKRLRGEMLTMNGHMCSTELTDGIPADADWAGLDNGAETIQKRHNLKKTIEEMDAYIAENTQLSCCLCTKALQDFNDLKKHFRQEHQCIGYMVCCDSRFRKRTLYVDHLRLHKDPDYFKCNVCNKTLASRGCLTNHMETMHPPEGALQFPCNLCPRKFAKQYILDYHIKSRHNTDRNFKCGDCNKGFKNSAILRQHLKTVHLNEYESVCDVCGKQLKTAQNLASHMEAIHDHVQKPEVQCEVCAKWVKNARCLVKHMIMHREEASGQEFKCKHCNVIKMSRRALSSHVRYHHSSKIYKCTLCGKEFKRNRSLEEHMSTHTGKDLYTCPFCPKTFKSHGNMHKHKTNNHSKEWVRKHIQPSQHTLKLLNAQVQANVA